jgi:hypothetical protein
MSASAGGSSSAGSLASQLSYARLDIVELRIALRRACTMIEAVARAPSDLEMLERFRATLVRTEPRI